MPLEGLTAALARIAEIQELITGLSASSSSPVAQETGTPQAASFVSSPPTFAEALTRAQRAQAEARPPKEAPYAALIRQVAARYGVDEDLVHAIVEAESDYNPRCVSKAGAMGLMQLMPATARALGLSDPWDPAQNLDGGVRYLRQLIERFKDIDLALAAYNAGPNAVSRYQGIPPYPETQAYVRRVLHLLAERKND